MCRRFLNLWLLLLLLHLLVLLLCYWWIFPVIDWRYLMISLSTCLMTTCLRRTYLNFLEVILRRSSSLRRQLPNRLLRVNLACEYIQMRVYILRIIMAAFMLKVYLIRVFVEVHLITWLIFIILSRSNTQSTSIRTHPTRGGSMHRCYSCLIEASWGLLLGHWILLDSHPEVFLC